jgi:hypothetical protein
MSEEMGQYQVLRPPPAVESAEWQPPILVEESSKIILAGVETATRAAPVVRHTVVLLND